ncbi:hypothetical protein GCM10023093_11670 [Nemorincola caseinilytica]|uniref:DegT/DnrJ/EryC1/StrS aminotransferase family protein n=1 Tax=Nemorincola caseinilytica TaxID=2054315 RepID=A0ABP8ND96_9BACT
MKEIGGYIELEAGRNGTEYHKGAVALNTARNAFEYILRAGNYKKVYIPLYHCIALITSVRRLGMPYEFFKVGYDFRFEEFEVGPDEAILYINYYGVMDGYIEHLSRKYSTLIVDNAHAFYSMPLPGVPTFYSCRKFFGLPDGAYLYTDKLLPEPERDLSFERYRHLVGRIDQTATDHFAFYKGIERMLDEEPVKQMSNSTRQLLGSIDYEQARQRRAENYRYLQAALQPMNRLSLPADSEGMSYPLLATKALLDKLIKSKVYCGIYWPQLITEELKDTVEYDMSLNLISLPIDQRYDLAEMAEIIKRIHE